MVTRVHRLFFRYNSALSISKVKSMEREKCYLRLIQSEDKVDINFLYKLKEDSVRQFNLSRRPSESLESILVRIGANIQKVLNKSKKKKGAADDTTVQANFCDDEDNPIDNTQTCLDLFSFNGPVKLKIADTCYDTIFNPPWVISVFLPKSILAGFPIYPENYVVQNADDEHTKFLWYKGLSVNEKGNQISDAHIKWDFLSSGYTYTPSTADIGMKLKLECVPGNHFLCGPTVEVLSSSLVEAGPGKCPFELRHLFTTEKLKSKSFRCVTYNILADLYCDSDFTRTELHPYCPPYALHIDYRKQLVLKELLGYNADVICLQEVDAKIFNHWLQPLLHSEGYDGKFYKKGKLVAEGLSCFYRKDRFSWKSKKLILSRPSYVWTSLACNVMDESYKSEEYAVLSEILKTEPCLRSIWESVKDNAPVLERLLNRSTVASATVLQSVDDPNLLLVAGNTHLYFHPDADHIRLIQGGMCIYWLRDIVNKMKSKFPDKTVSLILCGDFNSVPSCGIYQLYTTGLAPTSLPDWKSNENEAVRDLSLQQDIPLSSACGTPEYTNFTAGFADCLDYIFYDKANMQVEQVIPLPSNEELRAHTALPSIVFPSDHVALVADLRFNLSSA